jgi:DnaD/phage-associated family protein
MVAIYDQEIGDASSPAIQDSITAWRDRIPEDVVVDAFSYAVHEAVRNNVLRLSYVEAVLRGLEARGWNQAKDDDEASRLWERYQKAKAG